MTIINARMPDLKRVYNVYMPTNKRVYNMRIDQPEFIRSPCVLSPFSTSESINSWFSTDNVAVVANSSQWDITDSDSGAFETLVQVSEVTAADETISFYNIQIVANKESVDDHYLAIQSTEYYDYNVGGPYDQASNQVSLFNLVTGDSTESINPGSITNYVEDLGTQWKFVMEVTRTQTALFLATQVYPAYGTTYPVQSASGVGTVTVDCIHGYLSAYTP